MTSSYWTRFFVVVTASLAATVCTGAMIWFGPAMFHYLAAFDATIIRWLA